MDHVTNIDGTSLWLLAGGAKDVGWIDQINSTTNGGTFSALLWDHRKEIDPDPVLVRNLIASGCRYFMFGGHHYHEWENVTDSVYLDLHVDEDLDQVPKKDFVSTTLHPDEKLSEAVFYALGAAKDHEGNHFRHCFFIDIGEPGFTIQEIMSAIRENWNERGEFVGK